MSENLKTKNFARHHRDILELPSLTQFQTASFDWFIREGIKDVFQEFSPIKDYTGKELELEFLDYYLEEPKLTEKQAKDKELNYEAALRVKLRMINKKQGTTKEQEVYFGEIPVMTPRGTFIINGIEKVVISQVNRSPGVYFQSVSFRGINLFGAKLIPYHGSWLEFETDTEGAIWVKIDKKRKVAITALLKIFGFENNDDILNTFTAVLSDEAALKYIKKTIEKDSSNNAEEGYIEIYRRLRPGELATYDNSHDLINNMFFRRDRYDLAKVGRHKLNQRLGLDISDDQRALTREDLTAIIQEIIRLNINPDAKDDDIDHLGNRRIRAVGEILTDRFRVGIMRMRRTIQDRMATLDPLIITPAQLINPRQLVTVLKEFFNISQLCQFMEQMNMLSELEHKRKATPLGPGGLVRERAGLEVRDVHPSHYGRLCPIQTPEGQSIGLVLSLALYARLNEFGFIETPYIKVKNGRLTQEIIWLDAFEELKYKIAHGGVDIDERGRIKDVQVGARIDGEPSMAQREEIDAIDVSCQQIISAAVSLIPFLEHDESNRALMGANMQRQAVPCVKPQAPLVSTGIERKIALESGQCLLSEVDGEVIEVDSLHIVIKTKEGARKHYDLINFEKSNKDSCLHQKPVVSKGEKVKKGDLLADSSAMDNGVLALGQNLLVAFIPFYGFNYEDAIVISERVLKKDCFTSIYLGEFSCDVVDTKLGPEMTTRDIPNISEEKLKNLDEDGIIRLGAEVSGGDILVGKISPKGKSVLTPEERLLQAIFGEEIKEIRDTSLVLDPSRIGRAIRTKILSRQNGDKLDAGVIKRINVIIAELRKLKVGDKLAGRHGNKGVISVILPEEDMPYLEDGTPVDIILNPLGVGKRMNLGQVFENHLGLACHKLGYRAITPALDGASEADIKNELKAAGLPEDGKVVLYNGKTGEVFERKVAVGIMYIMKLEHMVEDKVHMRAIGPYSLITQQPLQGKAHFGGQRFGEMEVWALEGYGASYALQEMLTIKSDDVIGRAATYESIIRGERIKSPNIPAAFNVILKELQSLALSINLIGVKTSEDISFDSKEETKENKTEN